MELGRNYVPKQSEPGKWRCGEFLTIDPWNAEMGSEGLVGSESSLILDCRTHTLIAALNIM